MTRKILALATLLALATAAMAQAHEESRYYNPLTGAMEYGTRPQKVRYNGRATKREEPRHHVSYFGARVGAGFSRVGSDDYRLNGGSTKTGLEIGLYRGIVVTPQVPLFFEIGLSYVEKGGKKKGSNQKMTYDLDYIELPFGFKYSYDFYRGLTVQPMFGGYLAIGVAGKTRDYETREAVKSFSGDYFKRFDGGLRVGLGIGYSMLDINFLYDIGLADICHDHFDRSHNSCMAIELGIRF